jgi:hypothetical protein
MRSLASCRSGIASARVRIVRLVGLLTALAVLLPGPAFARGQYFCRMMNRVVATCCCEREAALSSEAHCAAKIRMTDCCERMSASARTPALAAAGTDIVVPPAAIASTIPALQYFVPRLAATRALPAQARAPPGIGPPLFIAHCSLLK